MTTAPHDYPSGIYGPSNSVTPEDLDRQNTNPGNDPSWISGPVMAMSESWVPIDCCVGGTQYFRKNAGLFLPREPKEDYDAWQRRVSHATLSPFLTRLAEQAAGLILRKPCQLVSKEEDGEVDPYWTTFAEDIDGYGTSLDTFARRLAISSILFGHAVVLVDMPNTEAAANLQEERDLGLRPYFIEVDAKSILGWRKSSDSPIAPLGQVRINEYVSQEIGEFGDQVVRQIRVLEQGTWRVYRKGEAGWYIHEQGTTSLPVIPMAVTYSNKVGELTSKPPMLSIANLNILHGQRTADLQHALHVAALPILVLQGFDDTDSEIGLSANSAILLPETGQASYVEPVGQGSFQAQQDFITELENQMSSLGISTLFAQKMGAETAESKRLSRTDSDSLLSVVSKDLERCLQNAIDIAAAYVNMEAPQVQLDRDFDTQVLDGNQVTQYTQLWTQGAITHETFLEMLKKGEVLPDVDVEREVELVNQEKLANADLFAAGGVLGDEEEQDAKEREDAQSDDKEDEGQSEIRAEVEKRLKRLGKSSDNKEEDKN